MRKLLLTAALLALSPAAMAGTLTLESPHAYEGVAAVKAAGVFVTVHNAANTADKLISASTPNARVTELHTIIDEDGVKKMRAVDGFEIPANGHLTLARGGDHIMLIDVKEPLKAGETLPLTLTFENAGTLETTVEILPQSGTAHGHGHHHHH